MTTDQILEIVHEQSDDYDEPLLLADGLEDALLGILEGCGRPTVLCYDYDLCIKCLMRKNKWDEETAHEWMEFNVVGAYVGKTTPLFLHNMRRRRSSSLFPSPSREVAAVHPLPCPHCFKPRMNCDCMPQTHEADESDD